MGDKQPDVKRADAKDDRLAMLKELAKLTKPTGPSAKGEAQKET